VYSLSFTVTFLPIRGRLMMPPWRSHADSWSSLLNDPSEIERIPPSADEMAGADLFHVMWSIFSSALTWRLSSAEFTGIASPRDEGLVST
jgi:hypothetical protein